jgi:signal transduction histidine kinase
VRISATEDQHVAVCVLDNGIGIPPENLTRIFAQGYSTRKDGHGFGLHSSMLMAQDMRGTLKVVSAGPGQGAAFTLELPVAPSADPSHRDDQIVPVEPMATPPIHAPT